MRLDHLVSQKYGLTRNKAQQLIKNGLISVNSIIVTKTALEIRENDLLVLKEDKSIAWVSRSAGKLDEFFESLIRANIDIDIQGRTCLDIGSSTGGFTQVLLERGAHHIDAVDVGSDQLHANIRNNEKVSSYENMDIRKFSGRIGKYGVITIDVSFISLEEILPELERFSDETTQVFVLFKPQFEVGREHLRKTGVPKSEGIIESALISFREFLKKLDYDVLFDEKASVVGEAGNQEYMFFVKKRGNPLDI